MAEALEEFIGEAQLEHEPPEEEAHKEHNRVHHRQLLVPWHGGMHEQKLPDVHERR